MTSDNHCNRKSAQIGFNQALIIYYDIGYLGPRRPSSWRHPGGTVSETEESEFAEAAAAAAAQQEKAATERERGTIDSIALRNDNISPGPHSSISSFSSPGMTLGDNSSIIL